MRHEMPKVKAPMPRCRVPGMPKRENRSFQAETLCPSNIGSPNIGAEERVTKRVYGLGFRVAIS